MTNSSKTLYKSARSNLSFPRGHFFPKNANFRYQKYWTFFSFFLFMTFVSSSYEISPEKIFENSHNYRIIALKVGPFFCLNFDAIFVLEKIIRLQYHLCQNNSVLSRVKEQNSKKIQSNGKKFIISWNRVFYKTSILVYGSNEAFLDVLPLNKFLLEAVFFGVKVSSDLL